MKKLTSTVLTALCGFSAMAQYNLGVATGNWSGMNGMYLNPAVMADNRHYLVFDVLTVNAGVDNSLGSLNTKGGVIGAINKGNTTDIFNYSGKDKFSMLAPYAEVRGPGFMWAINTKHSIAFSTRLRGMNQLNNFDKSVYQAIANPNSYFTSTADITSANFNFTAHMWSEIGASYAVTLLDDKTHRLKAGITARYLGGIGYVGIKGNNLSTHFDAGNLAFNAYNSDLQFASNIITTDNVLNNGLTSNNLAGKFFGSKGGWGIGGDLGLIYEFTDHERLVTSHSQNDYILRVSASLLDWGHVTYKAANNANVNVTGNGVLTGQGLIDNVRSYDDFTRYATQQGFTANTQSTDTKVYMPTRMVLSADYFLTGRFYANATFVGSLANRQNFGTSFYNQISVTPRYDTRLYSVGVPLTYSTLSHSFKAGIGARISGFFFGSDDVLALATSKQYGFNFYFGGCIPFNKDKPITHIGMIPTHDDAPTPDVHEHEAPEGREKADREDAKEGDDDGDTEEKEERAPRRKRDRDDD